MPSSQSLYVYVPPPRLLMASVWEPSLAVVVIFEPLRKMSTLVEVAPDYDRSAFCKPDTL